MTAQDLRPGEWPDISAPGVYQRLVGLARRRLVGYEGHAEDVVSRVLVKWSSLSTTKRSVARIEQVVKTEAYSLLRSERRLRDRELRAVADPAVSAAVQSHGERAREVALLRLALAETCRREKIHLAPLDIEIFELLLAGFSLTGAAQATGSTMHEVRRSRDRWRHVCELTLSACRIEESPNRTQPT